MALLVEGSFLMRTPDGSLIPFFSKKEPRLLAEMTESKIWGMVRRLFKMSLEPLLQVDSVKCK